MRRPLARRKSLLDRFERKGVLAQQLAVLLDVCKRGLRGLSVVVDRGRLAEAGDLAVTYLHEHDLGGVARLPRDDERLRELQRRRPGTHFHRGYTNRPAPVAQGIERAPPERKVAGSIPARRTSERNPAPLRGAMMISFGSWSCRRSFCERTPASRHSRRAIEKRRSRA